MKTARRQDGKTAGLLRLVTALLFVGGRGLTGAAAQTIAITGGTVFPVAGPKIERGTVVITNGKIAAVGAGVAVPNGATVIDVTGKWVTPGLIHAGANAGSGVAGLGGLGEANLQGDVNASFNLLPGVDPGAFTIPMARTGGVTTGILSPNGTLISGQAVAIDFAGERIEDMTVKSPAAMLIDVSDGAKQAGGGSRGGIMARLRKTFNDALEHSKKKPGAPPEGPGGGTPAAERDALVPVVTGQLPVVLQANRKMDIENALRLVQEFKLKGIILGGAEGWKIASAIAAAQVPVALDPRQDIPSFDALGARLDNATLLRQAGVTVILAPGDPGGERNLRFAAGNAVRNGVSWDDALKAITVWPAQAFGLSDYGTLEVGKVGNVVVWSGDPFEFANAAEKVIIRGKETSLRTRENELRDRYRVLPVEYYKP